MKAEQLSLDEMLDEKNNLMDFVNYAETIGLKPSVVTEMYGKLMKNYDAEHYVFVDHISDEYYEDRMRFVNVIMTKWLRTYHIHGGNPKQAFADSVIAEYRGSVPDENQLDLFCGSCYSVMKNSQDGQYCGGCCSK